MGAEREGRQRPLLGAPGRATPSRARSAAGGGELLIENRGARRGMREALWDGVNAVRDAQGLQKAINVFSDGLEAVSALRGVDAQESFELLRLKNDMIAAHLTALSALTPRGFAGRHARSDYPQEAKHTYRVMARMDENARPYVWKEDLES